MALPPKLRALSIGTASAPNTLELWVDYLCPFSKKQFVGVNEHLLPLIRGDQAPWKDSVRIVLRPYPQPWHSSSTLLHDSALAVARLAQPDTTANLENPETNGPWVYSKALFDVQEQYYDGPARTKNADQIRSELANMAIAVLGRAPALGEKVKSANPPTPLVPLPEGVPLGQAFKTLVRVEKEGNAGSGVVNELKYCVKLGRQNGIHVTPTAVWNGLVEGSISSSFNGDDWRGFLEKNVGKPGTQ